MIFRRRLMRRSLCIVLLLFSLPWGCGTEGDLGSQPSVYGVQLHTHGSMSEGPASMQAHDHAARALGGAVDVIWWTDHDWRIAAHTYVDGFDFEDGMLARELAPVPLRMPQFDGREPLPDWASGKQWAPDSTPSRSEYVERGFVLRRAPKFPETVDFEITEDEARSGVRSLRLVVRGPRAGRDRFVLSFESQRRRHIASLASRVRLGLSLLPAAVEGDVRFALSIGLSQRAPGQRSRIEYVLMPEDLQGRATPAGTGEGSGSRIPPSGVERVDVSMGTELGVWNDWVIDLTEDAARHGLGGEDNALVDLALIVEVGPRARMDLYVDALTIERAQVGAPLFARERVMAQELSDSAMTHHVGQEISYGAHLNAYGASVPLVDTERYPHGLTPRAAVEWAHRHGGLISLTHFFGTDFTGLSHNFPESRKAFDASLERLIEQDAFGVDLLEVGYRERGHKLDAFLELWDGLSRAGVTVIGVGVSDSHDAEQGWSRGPNNFITWIYADSADEADLLAGLREGRAFFGDPTRFDGWLDLESDQGARMGEVAEVAPGHQGIRLRANGLRDGQSIRLIRDGTPVASFEPTGSVFEERYEFEISTPSFVRFEVIESGEPIALTNPIHFRLITEP
ncbi:MAG: hypothetical protein CBC48_14380 [bacterium TMED88]|nr:hypothetical protein [Deltaproteobacteria bacterium]OUV27389.1 MAG: hypothetical protein CBC48_14380 [bacterium TMED88]